MPGSSSGQLQGVGRLCGPSRFGMIRRKPTTVNITRTSSFEVAFTCRS